MFIFIFWVKNLHILVERLNRKEAMLIPKKVSTTLLGWIPRIERVDYKGT